MESDNEFFDDFDADDCDAYDLDEEPGEVLPCPACGAEIYEDAPRCPVCGNYITFATGSWSGKPQWWIALGALGIFAVILALVAWAI